MVHIFLDQPIGRKESDSNSDIIFRYPNIFQISDADSDIEFGYKKGSIS